MDSPKCPLKVQVTKFGPASGYRKRELRQDLAAPAGRFVDSSVSLRIRAVHDTDGDMSVRSGRRGGEG